jgi:hypothetical protein
MATSTTWSSSTIRQWEKGFLDYLESAPGDVLNLIKTKKVLDNDVSASLKAAIQAYKPMFPGGLRWPQGREAPGADQVGPDTRKITRTMELVATSKLKRAQDRVVAARPLRRGAPRGDHRAGDAGAAVAVPAAAASGRRRKGGPPARR